MEITKASLDMLTEQREYYDKHLAHLRNELKHYYEQHGHTNHDWLDRKIDRLEAELSGFIEAARIMGVNVR